MADTIRSRAALAALLPDNVTGEISPQDARDVLISSVLRNSAYKTGIGNFGTTDPAKMLEVLDSTAAQLRLTHTPATKYCDFLVGTNHDLTITPSSNGQIKLQPTVDSTDFFQVLDADGGTPILSVDSTNERIGVRTSAPGMALDVAGGSIRLTEAVGVGTDTLVHILGSTDDGLINIYQNNTIAVSLNGNGKSYFNGGSVGIGDFSGINPDGKLHCVISAADNPVCIDTYSTTDAEAAYINIRKSASAAIGTGAATTTGEALGGIRWYGCDSGSNFDFGASILAYQDGVVGTRVPTNLKLETYSATAINSNQLVLHNDGFNGFNTDAPDYQIHLKLLGNVGHTSEGIKIESANAARILALGYDGLSSITNDEIYINSGGSGDVIIASGGGLTKTGNIYPHTDDTYYLGKNDDDSPAAWKGVIMKDTTDGKYYRLQITNGAADIIDLTD